MARLPVPGQDAGQWGAILNDFLSQAHLDDGTLKPIAKNKVMGLTADITELSDQVGNLAPVASSGSYSDLTDTPTVPLDASLVHKASAETITGAKNFTGGVTINNNAILTKSNDPVDAGKVVDAYTGAPFALPVADTTTKEGLGSKLDAALLPLRLAVANRGYARTNIFVHGDSTDEGIGATSNDRGRTWPYRLGVAIRSRLTASNGGEIIDPRHPNFIPACSPSAMHTSGVTSWWNIANPPTGWVVDESRGPNGYALRSDGSGAALTLTLPSTHGATTLQLVYRRGPNSTDLFAVTVNGTAEGAAGTLTLTPATGTVRDGTFTGIKNISTGTAYTVVCTPSAGATPTIEGVLLFGNNYNRGTVVHNVAKGGARVKDWLDTTEGGKGWAPLTATADSGVNFIADFNPDLIIRGGFYNDMQGTGGVSAALYQTQEQALIARMRAVLPSKTVPVILLTKWKPADAYLADPVSRGRVWEDYTAARDAIAAADPYTIHLNLDTLYPRPGSAAATSMSAGYYDNVHGGDRVYGAVGDFIASLI